MKARESVEALKRREKSKFVTTKNERAVERAAQRYSQQYQQQQASINNNISNINFSVVAKFVSVALVAFARFAY
uniref:Uncharacterized protein n=1 Tax=Glossina pallidipes TaxID=7398 RepID=A0A1A9ZD69_GLOPL